MVRLGVHGRYSLQNRQKLADGRTVPWIDEVQDPYTGDWIAYRRWTSRNYAYNHSTFCDLVISGLVGLKVAADGRVTADPFIPDDWGWFRLANVPVRGRLVSVTYDRDGTHYGRGKGLRIASEGSRGAAELYAQHTAATGRRSTCSSAIASPFLAQPIDNPFFCLI